MSDSVPDGWKSVKLDDVAEETSDRVDNPSKSGYDRFVGLEHLDSGELIVRRWGSTADLLSAMKLFKSGDILIGRRNAYLKRASKAEFDGVCSGDAYVVREKPGKIAEGLLPIILNSDSFWDYTIAHASGTMSKRAKWRDLTEYSFLLPSMDKQRRIATTLWAAEDCIVKGEGFVVAAERVKQILMQELLSEGIEKAEFKEIKGFGKIPKNWEIKRIQEIVEVRGRIGWRGLTTEDYVDDGPILLGVRNILATGILDISDITRIPIKKYEDSPEIMVQKGDVLLAKTGATIGKTCVINNVPEPMTVNAAVNILRPKKNLDSVFLNYLVSSEYLQKQMQLATSASARGNLFQKDINNFICVYPPFPEQLQIATILTRCDETIAAARANVGAAKALKMKMINEMLSPNANA